MSLTFSELRRANLERLPLFKDRRGRVCHHQPEGQPVGFDWALSQWSNAVCGELGEAANIIKKIERGDMTLDEARADLGREIADVQTYLDLLAHRAGVDLGAATIAKWNEVSERIEIDLRLAAEPVPDELNETREHGLLPCPFCGSVYVEYDEGPWRLVKCNACPAYVEQSASEVTRDKITAAWNRRAAQAADETPLRKAFGDLLNEIASGRKGHLGDHYIYTPQISEARVEQLRAQIEQEKDK